MQPEKHMDIHFEKASLQYAKSFGLAVDTVARERKYLGSPVGFPEESTLAFVKNIEQKNLSQFYAIDGDAVVGWCDILPKAFEGMRHVGILGMGVLASYRGKGIGRQLLQLAIGHAKTVNRLEKVELEVYKSNTVAFDLYVKEGFVIEGERVDSRKLDGKYDNIILMGKKL
jgi:ribosomal protein S18 acetylase RimI-like enzyme